MNIKQWLIFIVWWQFICDMYKKSIQLVNWEKIVESVEVYLSSILPFGNNIAKYKNSQSIQEKCCETCVIVFTDNSNGFVDFDLQSLLINDFQLLFSYFQLLFLC